MDIRPIRTEADYQWALSEVQRYFENEPRIGSPEGDRFEILADLVEVYESRHWPIEAPGPVEALQAFMQMRGFTQGDLAELPGSKSRASEVLRGQRGLSLDMIRRINVAWHIPAEILIGEAGRHNDAA